MQHAPYDVLRVIAAYLAATPTNVALWRLTCRAVHDAVRAPVIRRPRALQAVYDGHVQAFKHYWPRMPLEQREPKHARIAALISGSRAMVEHLQQRWFLRTDEQLQQGLEWAVYLVMRHTGRVPAALASQLSAHVQRYLWWHRPSRDCPHPWEFHQDKLEVMMAAYLEAEHVGYSSLDTLEKRQLVLLRATRYDHLWPLFDFMPSHELDVSCLYRACTHGAVGNVQRLLQRRPDWTTGDRHVLMARAAMRHPRTAWPVLQVVCAGNGTIGSWRDALLYNLLRDPHTPVRALDTALPDVHAYTSTRLARFVFEALRWILTTGMHAYRRARPLVAWLRAHVPATFQPTHRMLRPWMDFVAAPHQEDAFPLVEYVRRAVGGALCDWLPYLPRGRAIVGAHVASSDEVYLADSANARVVLFSRAGCVDGTSGTCWACCRPIFTKSVYRITCPRCHEAAYCTTWCRTRHAWQHSAGCVRDKQ
jgi:hypothetical protein